MLPTTTISANGTSPVLKMRDSKSFVAVANVTGEPTGGSPTLDVYIQHSADQGVTYQDLIHFPQFTTSNSVVYAAVSGYVTGGAACIAHADASIAANTVVQGPYGDYLRARWIFAAGNSGTYTLSIYISEKI